MNSINKRLSFTGVSSALCLLFAFPVHALTDKFNYSCRCLVETKVPIFSSRSYNTYSLKTSSYLLCYVNYVSCLQRKLLKQTGQLARTFILRAEIKH